MAYKIFKNGDQYCIYNMEGGKKGKKVPGSCQPTRQLAVNHMKSLYVNVPAAAVNAALMEDFHATLVLAAEDQAVLVDLKDVEILKAGIEYDLASGLTTFTPEDLRDAAEAPNNPNIRTPRIKLGHEGPLAKITTSDEPAVGTVQDMYVTDDGQTLKGTLKGVPEWLADILASAYPSRSIEGKFNEEVNGHKYRLVINDLSLLGVIWPGCSSLEDLQALYSKEGPSDITLVEAAEGEHMGEVKAEVIASVSAEDVRRKFYEEVATGERSYWWITAQYVDPATLISDDGMGNCYSTSYSIKGDEVTFSDPKEVKIQYVEEDGTVAAEEADVIFASRAESVRDTLKKGDIRCHVSS